VRILCAIPARGGSKRIPHKNRVDFAGKPLFLWTVYAALKCSFERIVVGTDDDVLFSQIPGSVSAHRRGAESCSDSATVLDATREMLFAYERTDGKYDGVCILLPTAPLRTSHDILRCLERFDGKNIVMAVSHYNLPPWQALTLNGVPFWDTADRKGQQVPDLVCDAGSVYIINRDDLMNLKTLYSKELSLVEIPIERAVDIDDENTLSLARTLARGLLYEASYR
jgi:N-acylneuraminate cytidylyltransferase